jgi:hypothetical protein
MKTTATNRKIRELLTSLREKKLIPNPDFQRRLVWNNRDKIEFLKTVLDNYPFPEIYVAIGDVNVETGEGTELLVDGQQRLTTLFQYFTGSPDLVLSSRILAYADLSKEKKEAFLQYDVVVRDLGSIGMEIIKTIFQKINATSYSLNAMEIRNSRYEGEFKKFAEEIAQKSFFDRHRIFNAREIKRMEDTRFVAVLISTILSTYFNRDESLEEFLTQYNDEFPMKSDLERDLDRIFLFVEDLDLPLNCRAWKKADLFNLLIELYYVLIQKKKSIQLKNTAEKLLKFYAEVDNPDSRGGPENTVYIYYKSTLQGTNDRSSRIARGQIIREILLKE